MIRRPRMSVRLAWSLTAGVGLLGVVLGAFGSHALSGRLSEHAMMLYDTAVSYQFYHTIALFMVGVLLRYGEDNRFVRAAGWCFIGGIAGFCGSLYVLSVTGEKAIAFITPLGGAALILGWLLLLRAALRFNYTH